MPDAITTQPGTRAANEDSHSTDVFLKVEPPGQTATPIEPVGDEDVTDQEKKKKTNNDYSCVSCYDDNDNFNIFFLCECISWLFHNCAECIECCCTGCCECLAEVGTACSGCDCDCDCDCSGCDCDNSD